MLRVLGCIFQQHDLWLVVLAALICLFACYTAFSLLARAHTNANSKSAWLVAAAFVTGSGVWATHFVAELAFKPGMAVGYDWKLTVLSVLIAVAVAGIGLTVAVRPGFAAIGGAIVGAAVAAMHYTGMAALEISARAHWDTSYIIASLLIAVGLGSFALWRAEKCGDFASRVEATGILLLAIVGLHFTAMTAVTYIPDPTIVIEAQTIPAQWLAVAIAAVTFMILGLGLTGSVVDEHLAQRASNEATRLRQYVTALESTKLDLENTTEQLRGALNEASAASKAKSQFLAAMSHELRTPLNAIIGFSEILKDQLFGPIADKRYTSYHTEIHNSGTHLLGLINDILDFSKLDAGAFELREEEVDIHDIAASCMGLLSAQAEKASVILSNDIPADLPHLAADPRRLRQVLLNLLSNAVKFTPQQGQVRLCGSKTEAGIEISITDTGIGMAQDDIPKAFELFGQIDNALSRKYEGTGLGLPLAKRLTELHGGRLTLESKINVGTRAVIFLPAARIVRNQQAA